MYKEVDEELLHKLKEVGDRHIKDDTSTYFSALYETVRQYAVETGEPLIEQDVIHVFADWMARNQTND